MTDSTSIKTKSTLASRGFIGLLVTQFFGAFNDNMFRWLAVPLAKQVMVGQEAMSLSIGLACFTVPYLILASPAGFLADRFSKRTVIVGCKVAEVLIMLIGLCAILMQSVVMLFIVVGLMGCQSALFCPAKFGSIPELVSDEDLSKANGWMGMITVSASAFGTIAGNFLFATCDIDISQTVVFADIMTPAIYLLGVAAIGLTASLFITRLPAADPSRKIPPNPIKETYCDLKLLVSNTVLFRASLGIAFFWMLASLANLNIDVFGTQELGLSQSHVGIFLGVLVVGVAVGSVLAGIWSEGKVELGIVPMGALGIVLSSFILYFVGYSIDNTQPIDNLTYYAAMASLGLLGLAAGLFDIPLESFLQYKSDTQNRGTILAANNFVSFSFILVAAGAFYVLQDIAGLKASQIFLIAGLGTIPIAIYIFLLLPNAAIRFAVWLACHTIYRLRVYGRDNLPKKGGALLVANHVSWLDGILLIVTSSRPIRMIAYQKYIDKGLLRWLSNLFGVIPIDADGGPKSVVRSLRTAREAVMNGELVCIFAEGTITRTGQLQPFQRGLLRIIDGTDAPVIPVYLDELWGSVFSFERGRFFWKRPKRFPYPVSVLFGEPLKKPKHVNEVRFAVQLLGVKSMEQRKQRERFAPSLFVRRCRKKMFSRKVADSGGAEVTGGKLLTATIMFQRILKRQVLAADEKNVGLLLPPSAGGVIANTAVSMMNRVAVNLNYTLTEDDINFCIKESGIKHILTSKKFLEKKPFNLDAEFVYLEDLKEELTVVDKLAGLFQAFCMPAAIIDRMYGLNRIQADDLMTIIFTSGSTGRPKGVMLSHHNILSNINAIFQTYHIDDHDSVFGVLPFFHSFGYTVTLWMPLALDASSCYHFNPLDGRTFGKMCEKYKVTITAATPTFLRTYIKRCTPEQLKHIELMILGAEKMPVDLAHEFESKFGCLPIEGYGTTELSPVVAANIPASRAISEQDGYRLGTIGRTLPGIAAKVVHQDTREDLGLNVDGLLLIKGPNVMQGYLNRDDLTAEAITDGWYNTGDIAQIDEEGFISITGRQSRFSKIGGEMVPHVRIEELLIQIVAPPSDAANNGEADEDGVADLPLAVTSVSDPKKGERLIVIHKHFDKPVDDVLTELAGKGIPNLWIPSADCFLKTEDIPLLGTGKLDLKGIKTLAEERFGQA